VCRWLGGLSAWRPRQSILDNEGIAVILCLGQVWAGSSLIGCSTLRQPPYEPPYKEYMIYMKDEYKEYMMYLNKKYRGYMILVQTWVVVALKYLLPPPASLYKSPRG
jgi:hypothetical protein